MMGIDSDDPKIDKGTMRLTVADVERLRGDDRVRFRGQGRHGVSVTLVAPHFAYGHTVDVELTDSADYARFVLAPFHAFYDSAQRVHVIEIVDPA